MRLLTPLLLSLACLGWPLPSNAQTATRQVFSTAAVSTNMDDDRDDHLAAMTRGLGLSFGVDFAHAGIEVGTNLPRWHVLVHPAQRFRYAGASSGYLQQGHVYERSSGGRRRAVETSVVFRRRVPLNRTLTMAWVFGGAFVHRSFESSSVTREVQVDGSLTEVNRNLQRSTRDYLAGVAGVETLIRLTSSLTLVPRLRVTAFPSLLDDSGLAPRFLVARPDLALRWTFSKW